MSIFSEWGIREGKDRYSEEFLYNLAACYVTIEKKLEQILAGKGLSPVKMNALLMVKQTKSANLMKQLKGINI